MSTESKTKTSEQAIDDFWTSVGIMQGPGRASVRTERIKKLEAGEISLQEATPEGESAANLVLTGLITKLSK